MFRVIYQLEVFNVWIDYDFVVVYTFTLTPKGPLQLNSPLQSNCPGPDPDSNYAWLPHKLI